MTDKETKEADAAEQVKAAAEGQTAEATPDATYTEGSPADNVNAAVPADAPVITTYEDALAAGYFGYAPGHANTEKLSVAAVTKRDAHLVGAVINASDGDEKKAAKRTGSRARQ